MWLTSSYSSMYSSPPELMCSSLSYSIYRFIKRQSHIIQIQSIIGSRSGSVLRAASPLLYGVCCLQGLRFYKTHEVIDTETRRELYEEVRDMLGQVVLASPLPLEELYAMLIMCTFEAAPKVCASPFILFKIFSTYIASAYF